MIVRGAVLLDGASCARLARVLAPVVRPDRVGVDRELVGLVEELAVVGRAWRASISELGNSEVPTVVVDDFADDALTTRAAAVRLGCGDRRVRQLLKSGRLAGTKAGGTWRISFESAERVRAERGA